MIDFVLFVLFFPGSLIFAIPHFVTPNYVYQETALSVCGSPNQTSACDDVTDDDTSLSYYYRFFIIAQVSNTIDTFRLISFYTIIVILAQIVRKSNCTVAHFRL